MKEDVKDIWVKGLRSGKFKQGKGRLQDGDRFCCLALLCLCAPQEIVERTAIPDAIAGVNLGHQKKVMEWSGIQSEEGWFIPYPGQTTSPSLAQGNDQGLTFNDSADIIEDRWEEL